MAAATGLVLGIETSCDETGAALYDPRRGLVAHALFSQVELHAEYGGVVPELASRDHVRRLLPLVRDLLRQADATPAHVTAVAYTLGPGLAGALLVGAGTATALAYALGVPAVPVHHLEGHLLSPLLGDPAPDFPFVCLLVSGGHTQLMEVHGVGRYRLLGETLDDAAGEAFDKTAQLLGLGYPGGPALARLAARGRPDRFVLPRPMIASVELDFSFSGLKTAVALLVRRLERLDATARDDVAASFQAAIVDVLTAKAEAALRATGLRQLVIAGGVGANQALRERLADLAPAHDVQVFYPPLEFCTDNGAMIALAGALRLAGAPCGPLGFSVRPRWNLESLPAAA